jgi:hypothetical protein
MPTETFLRTGDGRFRGLRFSGCLYLVIVAISLIGDGWQSRNWIAWLLLALGFFGMSEHVESAQSRGSKWRSPHYVLGMCATLLGLGLMVYQLVVRHLL